MEKIFYLAQVFSALHALSIVLIVVSIFVALFLGLWYICDVSDFDSEESSFIKKVGRYIVTSLIIGALMLTFCPTKKTYLFMVGGRVVDELVENNPTIREIPGNTIDLLNEYIKLETEKIRNKRE